MVIVQVSSWDINRIHQVDGRVGLRSSSREGIDHLIEFPFSAVDAIPFSVLAPAVSAGQRDPVEMGPAVQKERQVPVETWSEQNRHVSRDKIDDKAASVCRVCVCECVCLCVSRGGVSKRGGQGLSNK